MAIINGTTSLGLNQSDTLNGTIDGDVITADPSLLGEGLDIVNANSGDDVIYGGAGADTLNGEDGNDTIYGGVGNDLMTGGNGQDTYMISSVLGLLAGNDIINNLSNDDFTVDRIVLGGLLPGDINNTSRSNDDLLISYGLLGDSIRLVNFYTSEHYRHIEFQFSDNSIVNISDLALGNITTGDGEINGTDFADILTGGNNNDAIYGGAGFDTLVGNGGNDTLDGGTGTDTMIGGQGDDLYVVTDASDVVVELADQGVDTVRSGSISLDLANYQNVEHLVLTGVSNLNLTGSNAANILTGNDGNNTISGLGGNDVIDGGYGFDQMIGGDGDDVYFISEEADEIVELVNGGTDIVYAEFVSIDLTRYAHVEHATLLGNLNLNIIGSHDAANTLTGNSGNNTIMGNASHDTLIGNDGDDILDGNFGKDTMIGGQGNDTYCVSTIGDQVVELVNQGSDTVITNLSYALGAHVEHLTLTGTAHVNGTGNVLDNHINGNSGNNVLNGGGGVDQLYGGAGHDVLNGGNNNDQLYGGDGDDVYYVNLKGDQVFELSNQGNDTVHSLLTYTLGDHLENLVLSGTQDLQAYGNHLDNQITGNSGNNFIVGGQGNNTLMGAGGDDLYRLNRDFATNTVVEAANAGFDSIQFGVGVVREQVWFSRVDDDLVASIIGTNAKMVVQDWYAGGNQVESFRLTSGRTLMATHVDTLVNAMASLTPPAFGETTLSNATKAALGSVFADTWNVVS